AQYGTAGAYGLERQFLHATRLAFAHPVTGAPIDVISPLPDDLERALELARGDSAEPAHGLTGAGPGANPGA
ncbi:MAG TPA: hypothetical protein VNR66_15305, partial [Solirubrobacteraceae bacterium]|nr:hypothetical protein [Solirubrobacteraceae bacterium]